MVYEKKVCLSLIYLLGIIALSLHFVQHLRFKPAREVGIGAQVHTVVDGHNFTLVGV